MMYSAYKLNKQGDNIYSLDIPLFLFGTSLLFHVQFWLLLPDLHTGFSRGRSGWACKESVCRGHRHFLPEWLWRVFTSNQPTWCAQLISLNTACSIYMYIHFCIHSTFLYTQYIWLIRHIQPIPYLYLCFIKATWCSVIFLSGNMTIAL